MDALIKNYEIYHLSHNITVSVLFDGGIDFCVGGLDLFYLFSIETL